MEVTLDLDPEAYDRAQKLAEQQGLSVGKVLGDAVLKGRSNTSDVTSVSQGPTELRAIPLGGPVTSEQIKAMIAEDEEWEITRGNPYHPWYAIDPERTVFAKGYPRVIDGPFGIPEVQLKPTGEVGDETADGDKC